MSTTDATTTTTTEAAPVAPVAAEAAPVTYALQGKVLDAIVQGMGEVTDHETAAMRSEFDRTVGDGVMLGKLFGRYVKPAADAAGIKYVASVLLTAMADPTSVLFVPEADRVKFVSASVLSRALDFARLETSVKSRAKFLKNNAPDAKFYLTALKIDAGEQLGNRDTTDVDHYKATGIIRKKSRTVNTPDADAASTTTTTTEAAPVATTEAAPVAPIVVRPWSDVETMDADGLAAILASPAIALDRIPAGKRVAIIRTLMAAVLADAIAEAPLDLADAIV